MHNKAEQAIASQRVLFSLPSVEHVDCSGGLARLPVLQRSTNKMEFETQYPVTDALQRTAAKQLFFSVMLKKKWIGILAFWIAAGLSLFTVSELGWALAGILLAVSFVLTVMWVKTYFMFQKQANDYLKTIDDPLTTLRINKEEFDISNSNGNKRITWNKIDRISETKDFLVPFIGKVPLICLPKDRLSREVSDFLREFRPTKTK